MIQLVFQETVQMESGKDQGTILIVDDDESMRELCEIGLRRAGYQVTVCGSGDDAVRTLESTAFDLVLTDFQMPGKIDGHGVVRAVKSRFPTTEAIVMTGMPTLQTAIGTLKDGAYDYIIKPFHFDHLVDTVRRCLDHRRLREDLKAERLMRLELESAYQELQKVENLKESFLARISHEIRTPLSQLTMSLQLMEDAYSKNKSLSPEQIKKYLDLARGGAERLGKTLMDLLAFVDLQRQTELGPVGAVNLESICRDVIERTKPLWEPRRLTVECDFDPGIPAVSGNSDLLSKAFQQLIHNAVVFNRDGGKITVHGFLRTDYVQIDVTDTGEGIPESEFENVFDSFYQIANYLTRKVEGLGLGLAITRRIIEAHRGEIRIASKPGEGSTFKIFIPTAAPRAVEAKK